MKQTLRYVFCVLLTFLSAAYAVSSSIAAFWSLGIHVWFSSSDTQGSISMTHYFNEPSFQWRILPVALSLTVCVAAWHYRNTKTI
jgi:hypothetical protein